MCVHLSWARGTVKFKFERDMLFNSYFSYQISALMVFIVHYQYLFTEIVSYNSFLTMEQTRKLVLLLSSDPKVASLPLVGV